MVITGTPGVGKSGFSKLLAERIGATYIDIGNIALREGLVRGTDALRGSKIANLTRISEWIHERLRDIKGCVVLEGHYACAVTPKRLVKLIIVLRCDPKELMKRLRKRRLPRRKVCENVAAEVLDVCLVDALNTFNHRHVSEIDTTHRTLKSILIEAMGLLDGRIKPSFGKVDWLGRLEEREELDSFMEYVRDCM